MIVYLFSLLDFVGGIALGTMDLWSDKALMIVGLLVLGKGIYSIAAGIASGWYFEFMGWIDILAGIMLLVGSAWSFMWLVMVIKCIYSVFIAKIFNG